MRSIILLSLAICLFFSGVLATSISDTLDVALQLHSLEESNDVDLLFDLNPMGNATKSNAVSEFVPDYPTFHPGRTFEPDVFNMNCAFAEFVFCCMVGAIPTVLFRKKFKSKLETAIFWWFAFDGMIHLGMEGSFVLISLENRFNGGAAVSDRHYLMTCVWTEYGKADFRWLYGDQNIVGFELVTVFFEAPLCFLILYGILKDSNWRHVVQMLICMGELYGLYATFFPEWIYGSPNLDGSTILYFWVYLGSNIPWAIIPTLLMVHSGIEICKAFQAEKDAKKVPQPQTSG